ncbi:hypothetical protein KIPB_015787, partial [Kipferlia bialata]|eukprot:g15787.t1
MLINFIRLASSLTCCFYIHCENYRLAFIIYCLGSGTCFAELFHID